MNNEIQTYEILAVVLFVFLGALLTMVITTRFRAKRGKKTENNKQDDMNNYDDYYQRSQVHYVDRGSSLVDESRPASVAIIYQSEMDYISRCIHDYPNIETGGQLFGFITEMGAPVVCYAIGPGPRANHQPAFFNQDTDYLQRTYNELNRRFGLRYIGEWHSHHQLGLAKPSGHDAATIVHGIERSNFRHFLLCIGNCDNRYHSTLNAFTFHINDPYGYHHAPWKVIEMASPYRALVDRTLGTALCHPRTQNASYGANYILRANGDSGMVTPSYSDEYWLNNKSNNLILKDIIDFLANYGDERCQVKPQLDEHKHVHLVVQRPNRQEQIVFGEGFPYQAPTIFAGGAPVNDAAVWRYDGDIYRCFIRYYADYFATRDEPVNETIKEIEIESGSEPENEPGNEYDIKIENESDSEPVTEPGNDESENKLGEVLESEDEDAEQPLRPIEPDYSIPVEIVSTTIEDHPKETDSDSNKIEIS